MLASMTLSQGALTEVVHTERRTLAANLDGEIGMPGKTPPNSVEVRQTTHRSSHSYRLLSSPFARIHQLQILGGRPFEQGAAIRLQTHGGSQDGELTARRVGTTISQTAVRYFHDVSVNIHIGRAHCDTSFGTSRQAQPAKVSIASGQLSDRPIPRYRWTI